MNKFMKVAIKEATKGINAHDGGPFFWLRHCKGWENNC